MLPKVATHLLHSTSRAAATIHHQSATIRNVLQLQTSSAPPSSTHLVSWSTTPGSSNWGGSSSSSGGGTSSGSAKYGTGSRFYYNGAGRAVTQANTTTTNDGTFHQSDETEEPPVKRPASTSAPRKSRRLRSNSLSIPSQDRSDRGEKLGVLRTVQLHARSKQTFAPNSSIHPQQSIDLDASEDATPTRPVHVRRNSTSSPPLPEPATLPNPSRPPTPVRHNSTLATSHQAEEDIPSPSVALDSAPDEPPPASLKSTDALIVDDIKALNNAPADTPEIKFLKKAMTSDGMDPDEVSVAARAFRASRDPVSVSEFNVALSALMKHRRPGDPLHEVLETYNEMLRRQITPTGWTYAELINAFTTRDHEVERVISALEWKCATADQHGRDCSAERKRLETLRKEDNFTSALSVFEALVHMEVTTSSLSSSQFTNLLRSCASRGALESAKHIYQHHVKTGLKPSAYSCNYLMQTHMNAGDLMGARKWFDQFNSERGAGKLYDLKEPAAVHRSVLQVWNTMIEAYFRFNQPEMAVGILEEMMDVTVDSATLQTAPPVATSTFAVLLAGFIRSGDVKTALSWFRRLLDQPNAPSQDPYHPIGFATSPDATAWSLMIDCLGEHRMVQELNELFTKRRPSNFTQDELQVIAFANIASLADLNPLDLLPAVQHVMTSILPRLAPSKHAWCIQRLTETCAARGMYEDALNIFMPFARALLASAKTQTAPQVMTVQSMQLSLSQKLYEATKGNIPFSVPLQLARLAADARIIQPAEHTLFFLHSYALSQQNLPADMGIRDWELLLYAAVEAEAVTRDGAPVTTVPGYAFEGLSSLLRDLVETKVSMDSMDPDLLQRIAELVARTRSILALEGRIAHLSPSFHAMLTSTELPDSSADGKSDSGYSSGSAGSEPAPKLKVDVALSKAMNAELRKTTPTNGVTSAYELFLKGLQDRLAPNPAVLGLMIQNLGRINKIEEVSHAYNVAQQVLQSLEQMKSWQKDSWFTIEDSMVIALAHHGNVDGAHMHRLRILDYGRAPSADAYGALIYNVRDTTDDASNALALFQEAQQLGVHANGYLYNNIISKLARARKADHALELFQQMKATSIPPTSVTYGAVIGACARVGDVASAEALFSEMVVSKNFKPRVPPYNTMIQMYTTTKPNRELALHYYDQLLQAKIKPTAYTYKLLMDAYGSIEPVNIRSMEEVFKKIQNDPEIVVQGNHYSSMINAYGCVQKNLDKAIEVFDSIPTSMTSRIADAVVFEAMINALVANRRTDLIPQYIEKMKAVGVHMTAYIANFLIKGYALAGDMDQARQTFESLEDPPEGIAAPNNHAPHDPSELPAVDVTAPVYREPSTWEAMVRAELGSGNREGALDLLERLRTRQYPEAVFNRISGIMVDHSSVFP